MKTIGIILIIILLLWLFFHKRTGQQEYFKGLALGASIMPSLMKQYLI